MKVEELLSAINNRMAVWFTTQMIAPDSVLLGRLEELAAEYDAADDDDTLTTGRFDAIMVESDKIQAELFRRLINELMDEAEAKSQEQ